MTEGMPLFALTEEHQAIREAVRAVCDAKVAPAAAEVDEKGAFPQAAYDALAAADFARPAHRRGVRRRRRRRAGHLHRDRGGGARLHVLQPDPER